MPTIRTKNIDKHGGLSPRYVRWRMVNQTTDYTLTPEDWGSFFMNRGASGIVTYTLPTPIPDYNGATVRFYCMTNPSSVVVNCETAGSIVAHNTLSANSVGYTTSGQKVGGCLEFTCRDSKWWCIAHQWDNGLNAQNIAIT